MDVFGRHWGELLNFIQTRGGYKGHAFTQTADLDDLITRFENLDLREL